MTRTYLALAAVVSAACSARAEKAALPPLTPAGRAVRVIRPAARIETGLARATGAIRARRMRSSRRRRPARYNAMAGGGNRAQTVLTLGIVPVVYSLLDGLRSRLWRQAPLEVSPPEEATPRVRAAGE
jgi:hypothetical protein